LLQYLNGTSELRRILGADELSVLRTWVDASYTVHEDMKSHTGGTISFGTGTVMCKSTKQKLNTKSSTEAEVVGTSDYIPNTIWLRMFLEAQGYSVTSNILYQDNQSAMRLEKNGRASAGQKSRHIDIRYFFIKDRLLQERMSIEHCPTEAMLADFFTKPLHKFRSVILGHAHIRTIDRPFLTGTEERVGRQVLKDGFNSHSQCDIEGSTYATSIATTLPSTDGWTVVNRRLRNERKAHSFDLIPSY
jgi:hypothetical protein